MTVFIQTGPSGRTGLSHLRPPRSLLPALFGVLVPLVVELQGDLGVQADAKVVVHDALLRAVPAETAG